MIPKGEECPHYCQFGYVDLFDQSSVTLMHMPCLVSYFAASFKSLS